MVWMALILPLLVPGLQDPAQDLQRELEKLRKENLELRNRLQSQEQSAIDDAQTIQRLRHALKVLEASAGASTPVPSPRTPVNAPRPEPPGPDKPIKGKLAYVDAKNGFVTLNIGKSHGVQPGYKFEIFRETYDPGGDVRVAKLGLGEFEKFLGGEESMSKVKILDGNIVEMKADDLAVAIRKLGPVVPPKEEKTTAPPNLEPAKDGIYAITGRAGIGPNAGYLINYGTVHGARQTDLLYVYKDGIFKAKLRIDKVDKTFSVANVVDGSVQVPIDKDDQIHVKEIKKGLSGKVALADDRRGMLAVDIPQRSGVKPGMRFEVRRAGQKIGTVLIKEVQSWGSWATPDGDTKLEMLQKGDFVELIDEK